MKRFIPRIIALGLLCAATAQAGTTVIDFNSDPTAQGVALSGSAAWVPYEGMAYDATTNYLDGFLQITPAQNSQSGTVVFPDFDNGSIVLGFTFDCWVRVGNGTGSDTPADGFSVSFARAEQPILFNSSTPGDSDAEEGTRTGVAVGFDAYSNGANDPVALDVWVDGVEVKQYLMPDQNGSVTDPYSLQTGPTTIPTLARITAWAGRI